jgi:hypothetical protein
MSSEIKANTISEVTSANGVVVDGVTLKDSAVIYPSAVGYCTAKIHTSVATDQEMINTTGTTNPYFTYSGDTTNIVGVNNHDIKLVKKGIYFIGLNFTLYGNSGTYGGEASCEVILRGSGSSSEDTTTIAKALGSVSESYDSTQTYSQITFTHVGLFNANDLINIYQNHESGDNAYLSNDSYLNICLIREIS